MVRRACTSLQGFRPPRGWSCRLPPSVTDGTPASFADHGHRRRPDRLPPDGRPVKSSDQRALFAFPDGGHRRPSAATRERLSISGIGLRDASVLMALALALRLVLLDRTSLWSDELFSVFWSRLSLDFLLGEGRRTESSPPLYYMLLHGWMAMAGDSTFLVRLPSAIFSAASVVATYALGRVLFDRPVALLAGVLLAVAPMSVTYAQEARPYALVALLNTLVLLALAMYARRAEDATARRAGAARAWPWLLLFVAAAVCSAQSHRTSLLFLAACFLTIGLGLAARRRFRTKPALAWLAAGSVIVACVADQALTTASLSWSPGLAWIDPLALWSVRNFFVSVVTGPDQALSAGVLASCAALSLVAGGSLPRLRLGREQVGLLVLIPSLFCLAVVLVSIHRPILLPRVGAWLVAPLCLLLARAAMSQPAGFRRMVACGTCLLVCLSWLVHYHCCYERDDWRAAARLLADEARCGGPVVSQSANALGLVYYEPLLADRDLYSLRPSSGDPLSVEERLAELTLPQKTLTADHLEAFLRDHPRAALALRVRTARGTVARLRDVLDRAPFRVRLSGELAVFCF